MKILVVEGVSQAGGHLVTGAQGPGDAADPDAVRGVDRLPGRDS